MYINPFVEGVLTTITLELVAVLGFIVYCAVKTFESGKR